MKNCPRCDAELGDTATACRCGWKEHKKNAADSIARAGCAHFDCQHPAICRMKTASGWANLCNRHYEMLIQTRADQTCQRLGLTTTAQKSAWVLDQVHKLSQRMRPSYLREPGEDRDEPTKHAAMQAIQELKDDLPWQQA